MKPRFEGDVPDLRDELDELKYKVDMEDKMFAKRFTAPLLLLQEKELEDEVNDVQ